MSVPIRWLHRFLPLVIVLILLTSLIGGGRWLFRPVTTRARAEQQLERELIAFQRWNGKSWIVADAEGGRLIFDHLTVDPISHEWPPTPRWQWTGNWELMSITSAPASVGQAMVDDEMVLWGQINSPQIVTLELEIDGEISQYPVSEPGYIVRTGHPPGTPDAVRWLDASSKVIFITTPVSKSGNRLPKPGVSFRKDATRNMGRD